MENKITVITPTFNRAHTLERVYQSIIRQNFKQIIWLIMDDGSTDNTKDLIQNFIEKDEMTIQYIFNENRKKYITLLDGILNYIKTDYFIIMDSDDEFYGVNSINFFFTKIKDVKEDESIASVCGHVVDSSNKIVGDLFPHSPFITSIFEMRFKYGVKGGKMAINDTRKFKKLDLDLDYYRDKGYVPDDIWQNIFDGKYKTMFINEIFKIYHLDPNDKKSLSTSRFTKKSAFGIMESYRTNLETNEKHYMNYPIVMMKKMLGYIYFGLHNGLSAKLLFDNLKKKLNRICFVILFIPALFLYYLKPLKN